MTCSSNTKTPEGHQLVLDRTDVWLEWLKTMRAKPKKCVCMAYRQFRKSAPPSKFTKVDDTIYSVYDPMLTISGQRMQFLQDDSFKGSDFKFLGRWLCPDLDEAATKTRFLHKFHELQETVDKAPLDGFMKLSYTNTSCWVFVLEPRGQEGND